MFKFKVLYSFIEYRDKENNRVVFVYALPVKT